MKFIKFILLLFTLNSFAQEIDLKWSEKIKTKTRVGYLGSKAGNYYTYHVTSKHELVCRSYNSDLEMKLEKIVELEFEKKAVFSESYFLKDKIVHFLTSHNKKEDKFILYAATTDINFNTTGQTKILSEPSDKDFVRESIRISPDSTKILVLDEHKGKRNDPNVLSLKVYNSDLTEVLLDRKVELATKSKNYSTKQIEIDDFGNAYILAQIEKERKEKEKDASKYYYKIIVISQKEANAKEFDFDFPERDIESIDILIGENKNLYCSGFLKTLSKGIFSNQKKTLISDEMFSSIIDSKTLSLKSANKIELDGLYPEKPKNTEDYVPYKIKDIFHTENGGSVIVAEQYKLVARTYTDSRGFTSTIYYNYFCDIATIHLNKNSEVETISKMPKFQMNAMNPSIISTFYKGSTYTIYEDLEKNLTAENDQETKRSSASIFSSDRKNALFLLTVAPTGEIKKEIIYSYKDSKIRPRIKSSSVICKNKILLMANDQIGILTIK